MAKRRITLDYILTFSAEIIVLVAGLLVYKLAASQLGDEGFSGYALSRRTISFIHPLLIIGLGVGIPRYIAFAQVKGTEFRTGSYFMAGMGLLGAVALPVLALLLLFPGFFSQLLFGSTVFAWLMPELSLMLCGLVLHSLAYAYFRGSMRMVQANLLQLINMGLVPMAAFGLGDSLGQVLLVTGLGWTAVASISCFFIFPRLDWDGSEVKGCMRELFRYGVQRMPGDVALAGFLALPAYFTAHFVDDNLMTAGYVAFSMSLLGLAGAAFTPICLILLPSASEAIVAKDFARLKRQTNRITLWTFGLTLFGLLIFLLFAEFIVDIYLGSSPPALIFCLRLVLLAAPGYTIYISLRSILDAYYVKAVNTKNIFIAFLLFLLAAGAAYFMHADYTGPLYGFVAAMLVLGALTMNETYRIFRIQEKNG